MQSHRVQAFYHSDRADDFQGAGDQFQLFRTDFTEVFHITPAVRTVAFYRIQTMDLAGKIFRKRPKMTGLAWNLRIAIPTVLTIALLFLQLQQGFGLFNLPVQLFRAGTEQYSMQFFYLCPQRLCFAFFIFCYLFCACQR